VSTGNSASGASRTSTGPPVRVTPTGVEQRGELRFQFADGFSIHGYVFAASDCVGEPTETDEALPLWTRVDRIPYAEMWEDDELWMPALLEGRSFEGRFLFDGDAMLGHAFERKPPGFRWS
jgi:8-oxo-dGTP diphosphatase